MDMYETALYTFVLRDTIHERLFGLRNRPIHVSAPLKLKVELLKTTF